MKVGIITFHASLNCGSMLQAYALQEVLNRKFGVTTEIINYSNKGQRQYYSLWDTKLRPRILKANLKALPYYKYIKKVNSEYYNFFNNYYNLSGPLIKKAIDLTGIEENYDIIIAGGDQIWNIKSRDADDVYFLSFVKNKKKVSYSTSLGGFDLNRFAKNTTKYRDYLKSFYCLSVREINGQNWLNKLIGKNVPIVADPTMLLTAREWCDYLPLPEMHERFIFYYAYSHSQEENKKMLVNMSEKTGLPVYVTDARSWAICKLGKCGIKLYKNAGPLGFLSLIKHAELVVTESFHGTLFSALFEKNFWSCYNKLTLNPNDDRAMSFLSHVGLTDRFIDVHKLTNINPYQDIDYSIVKRKIKDFRNFSLQYIRGFLDD